MPIGAMFIGWLAVETGVAAAIGTAVASGVGLSVAGAGVAASLAASTISTAAAVAIGSGVVSAGVSLARGASISDALKGAVIGGITSYVGASIASDVTSGIRAQAIMNGDLSFGTANALGKVAGAMAGGGSQAALGAVLTGKDPIDALIKGGLTAGLASGVTMGVNAVTSKIPGFNDLAKDYGTAGAATQRAINAGLAAGVLGKDVDATVVNSVLGSMLSAGGDYVKGGVKDLTTTLKSAYDNATKTGETLEANVGRQEEIIKDYQTTADDINAERTAIQTNLDKYVEAKNIYDNYYTLYPDGEGYFVDGAGREGGEGYFVDSGNPLRQSFLDETNKYANLVNDAIPAYEEKRTAVDGKLKGLSTELNTLQANIPALEKTLTTQKAELDNAVTGFQKQEEANTQSVVDRFNDTIAAKTAVEQATGTALTQKQLDAFIKTGDAKTAAAEYIDTNTTDKDEAAAALQKLGYTGTADEVGSFVGRTADADLGSTLGAYVDPRQVTADEAKSQFQDTYGYTPTDTELAQFTGQRDQTSTYTDIGAYVDPRQVTADEFGEFATDENFSYDSGDEDFLNQYLGQRDETATADAFRAYADPLATTDQEARDIYKTQYADMYGVDPGSISDEVLAQLMSGSGSGNLAESAYTSEVQGQFAKDLGFEDYATRAYAAESLGEARPDVDTWKDFQATSGIVDVAGSDVAPVQFDASEEPLALPFGDQTSPDDEQFSDSGVQTIPDEAPNIVADDIPANVFDVQTSPTAQQPTDDQQLPDFGARSYPVETSNIVERGLRGPAHESDNTEITPPAKLASATAGTATYGALTGADPTKTIGTSILDDESGGVRGGVQSDTLYSGAPDELTASNTITGKYFSDPSKPAAEPATDVTTTKLGANMDEDYLNFDNEYYGALGTPQDYERNGATGDVIAANRNSDGVLDYGEGYTRTPGSDAQEFMTENGKVIYYDDGRVETFDNSGRYVMYGSDGSVVDYSDINDPQGKVQTYGPGANGVPSGTYEGGKFIPGGAPKSGGNIGNKLFKVLTAPKTAALLAGAALGAASTPKGITPAGLRSIATGTGSQRVQTGAKGTGGKGSVRYFEKKAEGGAIKGGLGYLKSAHDGMQDKINATIDNKRPAKLSGGEFVVPADVVSHLGNGNSEAGAKQLYALMERVRKARTGTANQGRQINPKKYLPK